ncbi:MAG: hypothetical protein ACI97A_003691 [Planctomycetota bacterium]|jgi:hypothetical protein
MKTDAPGPFSCEIYIKSWEVGYRHGSTKLHIDNCSFCAPLVYGGTEEFPLSVAEQAKLNIADRKRKGRRLFFKKTAVAATLVAASIVGFDQFRDTAESTNQTTIQAELATDFASLDAAYATMGRSKIESYIASNNLSIVNRARFWIHARNHTNMYDLICSGLAHPKERVSYFALNLVRTINPIDLKSHLSLIQNCIKQTQDETLREELTQLVAVIESS